MHRIPIGIRPLLQRVLATSTLAPEVRAELRAAFEGISPAPTSEELLHWLPVLTARGLLTQLPPAFGPSELRLRYTLGDSLDSLSIPLPARTPTPGLLVLDSDLLQLLAPPDAATLAALHRLSGTVLGEGGRLVARAEIFRAAEEGAAAALPGTQAVYFPVDAARAEASAYAPPPELFSFLSPWSRLFDAAGRQLLLVPETTAVTGDECNATEHGVGALLGVEVGSREAGVHGYLEWRAPQAGSFSPPRLAQAVHFATGLTEHLLRASRLEGLLYVDRLTGAFNVNHFQNALVGEVARAKRDGKPMALLLADIDDFKRFNSSFGYEAGNQVLAAVAGVLLGGVRPFDSVARWGGEEFAVLLSAPVGPEEAQSIAERLRHQVEAQSLALSGLDGERHAAHVTLSMGVALYPGDAADGDSLWRAANRALLEAKRPPKNRVVLATSLEAPGAERRRPRERGLPPRPEGS